MSDPLAQFRRQPANAGPKPPGREPEDYAAFGAKDKVERLRIRRAMAPTRAPGYAYLLDIAYDGPFGTNIVLVYTFLMVMVRGRNLQPVIMALETNTADFIQEYDPDKWPKPTDPKAPFIESIEVVVKENGEGVAEAEKVSTTPKPH